MKDKEIKETLNEWQREGKFLFADAAVVFGISKQHLNNMIKGHVPISGKARKRAIAGIVFLTEFFKKYPDISFKRVSDDSRKKHVFKKQKLLKYLHTHLMDILEKAI